MKEFNDNQIRSAKDNVKNSSAASFKFAGNKTKPDSAYKPNNYDHSDKLAKVKKKSHAIANMIKTFALVVSAAVVGVVAVDAALPPSMSAEFIEVSAYETGVLYFVSLSEEAEDVSVVLYNDFTNREEKVEGMKAEGYFENLAPNMKYTIAIKQGDKIIKKQTIVTRNTKDYSDDYFEEDLWQNDNTEPIQPTEDQTQQKEKQNEDPTMSDDPYDDPYYEQNEEPYEELEDPDNGEQIIEQGNQSGDSEEPNYSTQG